MYGTKKFNSNQKTKFGGEKKFDKPFGEKKPYNKDKSFNKGDKKFSKPNKVSKTTKEIKICTQMIVVTGSIYTSAINPHNTACHTMEKVLGVLSNYGCHVQGAPQHLIYSYTDSNTNKTVSKEKIICYYTVIEEKREAVMKKLKWTIYQTQNNNKKEAVKTEE